MFDEKCQFTSMLVSIVDQKLTFESTGYSANVADCPFPCLRYYLNCVSTLLDDQERATIPRKFASDLERARIWTDSENEELLRTAKRWDPEIMFNRGLFIRDDNHQFCINSSNEFITFVKEEIKIGKGSGSAIASQTTWEVMYCTTHWVEKYFGNACRNADKAITAHRISQFTAMNGRSLETLKYETANAQRILALIPR
jgi:hypothetical protein